MAFQFLIQIAVVSAFVLLTSGQVPLSQVSHDDSFTLTSFSEWNAVKQKNSTIVGNAGPILLFSSMRGNVSVIRNTTCNLDQHNVRQCTLLPVSMGGCLRAGDCSYIKTGELVTSECMDQHCTMQIIHTTGAGLSHTVTTGKAMELTQYWVTILAHEIHRGRVEAVLITMYFAQSARAAEIGTHYMIGRTSVFASRNIGTTIGVKGVLAVSVLETYSAAQFHLSPTPSFGPVPRGNPYDNSTVSSSRSKRALEHARVRRGDADVNCGFGASRRRRGSETELLRVRRGSMWGYYYNSGAEEKIGHSTFWAHQSSCQNSRDAEYQQREIVDMQASGRATAASLQNIYRYEGNENGETTHLQREIDDTYAKMSKRFVYMGNNMETYEKDANLMGVQLKDFQETANTDFELIDRAFDASNQRVSALANETVAFDILARAKLSALEAVVSVQAMDIGYLKAMAKLETYINKGVTSSNSADLANRRTVFKQVDRNTVITGNELQCVTDLENVKCPLMLPLVCNGSKAHPLPKGGVVLVQNYEEDCSRVRMFVTHSKVLIGKIQLTTGDMPSNGTHLLLDKKSLFVPLSSNFSRLTSPVIKTDAGISNYTRVLTHIMDGEHKDDVESIADLNAANNLPPPAGVGSTPPSSSHQARVHELLVFIFVFTAAIVAEVLGIKMFAMRTREMVMRYCGQTKASSDFVCMNGVYKIGDETVSFEVYEGARKKVMDPDWKKYIIIPKALLVTAVVAVVALIVGIVANAIVGEIYGATSYFGILS